MALAIQQIAKKRGSQILFSLHNLAYADQAAFAAADYVVVRCRIHKAVLPGEAWPELLPAPVYRALERSRAEVRGRKSEFSGRIPGALTVLPKLHAPRSLPPMSPSSIRRRPRACSSSRIARELARRRPDIPLLVTQGRSRRDALKDSALGLVPHLLGQLPIAPTSNGQNITTMPFTPDPRDFYPAVFAGPSCS